MLNELACPFTYIPHNFDIGEGYANEEHETCCCEYQV